MSNAAPSTGTWDKPGRYNIRVQGRLDNLWAAWFDGLALTHDDSDGTTVIYGPIIDQAALHGVLQRIRDTGLPLISITRIDSDRSASAQNTSITHTRQGRQK